jgi:hypothetical protein
MKFEMEYRYLISFAANSNWLAVQYTMADAWCQRLAWRLKAGELKQNKTRVPVFSVHLSEQVITCENVLFASLNLLCGTTKKYCQRKYLHLDWYCQLDWRGQLITKQSYLMCLTTEGTKVAAVQGLVQCQNKQFIMVNYFQMFTLSDGRCSSIHLNEHLLPCVHLKDMETALCLLLINDDVSIIPCTGSSDGNTIVLVDHV